MGSALFWLFGACMLGGMLAGAWMARCEWRGMRATGFRWRLAPHRRVMAGHAARAFVHGLTLAFVVYVLIATAYAAVKLYG